VLISVYSY